MIGLLISGGDVPSIKDFKIAFAPFIGVEGDKDFFSLIEERMFVVCADSGADNAFALGIAPNIVVGDMDSISNSSLNLIKSKNIEMFPFPKDKDFSDTLLAYRVLKERGVTSIVMVGGAGGRFDHFLANFYSIFGSINIDLWITKNDIIAVSNNASRFLISAGKPVSFFSFPNGAVRVESEGLEWSLDSVKFGRGEFSLSNRSEQGSFSLKSDGRVAVIAEIDSGLKYEKIAFF